MSDEENGKLFTTGEIADLCGVSVRTVQYYDEKRLLEPTGRSDGGRRLYDADAIERLGTICLLKALGLSLKSIRGVLERSDDTDALLCLLEEQEKSLAREIGTNQKILSSVHTTIDNIRKSGRMPENIEPGMDEIMNRRTHLYRTKRRMLLEGLAIDAIWVITIAYGIMTGNWVPLLCAIPLAIIIAIELVQMYYRDARYVCPHCKSVFQPRMAEFFFAGHTSKTRKLTCTHCGKKDWCAETSVESIETS